MDRPLRPLLCRGPLLPDESLPSYLARLATSNRYEPPSILTKLCDQYLAALGLRDRLDRPKHPQTLEMLAALTCQPPRDLALASVHRFSQAPVLARTEEPRRYLSDGYPVQLLSTSIRLRYFLEPEHARFCPDCLREAAYHRLTWMLRDVSGCLKHQCVLVDRCQHCHALIHIQDIARCQCGKCGASLARAAPECTQMEALGVFAQRTLQIWWGVDVPPPIDETEWTLPELPVPTLYQLFERLVDSILARRSYTYRFNQTLLDQHTVQILAFKALTNWPLGFCAFLRECLEYEVRLHSYSYAWDFSEPTDLRNDSMLAFWVYNPHDLPGSSFVQKAVERFLAENGVTVYPNCWRRRICVNADEDLQKIARPIAQRGAERLAKALKRLYEE